MQNKRICNQIVRIIQVGDSNKCLWHYALRRWHFVQISSDEEYECENWYLLIFQYDDINSEIKQVFFPKNVCFYLNPHSSEWMSEYTEKYMDFVLLFL